MIRILSGPIGSGKTTRLIAWAAGRPDVAGVVSPVVAGHRMFRDLRSGLQWPMEAAADEPDALVVGRYRFRRAAFAAAASWVDAGLVDPAVAWTVIDEIGPLELCGEGFAPLLRRALAERGPGLVLVIRQGLVASVTERFGIDASQPFDPGPHGKPRR